MSFLPAAQTLRGRITDLRTRNHTRNTPLGSISGLPSARPDTPEPIPIRVDGAAFTPETDPRLTHPQHSFAGRDGEVLVVVCPSEVTHDSGERLLRAVQRHLPNRDHAVCVLDMAGVGLISSIGITALLQIDEVCSDRGARLVLAALPDRLRQFLKMLKLDSKFAFSSSVEDASAGAG